MSIIKTFCYFLSISKVAAPVVLQLSETECGIASLAMIFSYHDVNLSLEVLREKCGVSRDGCKAQTLINVARSYGFDANAYKVDIDVIKNIENPVIAYWNFNHYVVINRLNKNKVYINDPAHGALVVTLDEFDKSFTGVIIDIVPTKEVVKIKKKSIVCQLIIQWYSGFSFELFFLLLCLFIMGSIPYLNSLLTNIFIDQCIISKNTEWIPYIAIFSLLFAIILISTTVRQRVIQFKLYSKASILKSAEIIAHILQLPMLFYSLRQRSEIISILTRLDSVINLIFKNALNVMIGFITAILCFIFMIKINRLLSIVSFFMAIISAVIFYFLSKLNVSCEKSNTNTIGKLYSHSITSIKNIETVKACALEARMFEKWLQLFYKKIVIQDRVNTLSIIIQTFSKLCNYIATLLLLCIGGYQVTIGMISIGNLMSYYSLYIIFYNSVSYAFQALKEFQSANVLHARFQDLAVYQKDNRFISKRNLDDIKLLSDEIISISNLTFYYNIHSNPVLKDINIKIKQGEHIAFVGSTGSGKSTLSKLICAFYPPNFGEILLFGKSLSSFAAKEFAESCAYVSQDVSLFSGTIYQNLTMWKNDISMSIINSAIDCACLNDLIKERGLYGNVEEEGRNFSGGERQRIDIARALIQNTPVLILDEATSALDNLTENNLINNLRSTNKTIIFVAHRLSTIKHCDQILVLKEGRIDERDGHSQLMINKGHYYSLVANEKCFAADMNLCRV